MLPLSPSLLTTLAAALLYAAATVYQSTRLATGAKANKRLLVTLGVLAVVAGDFSDLKDHERPFGRTWSQILREAVPAEIPVVEHFGFGHENRNLTFVHGLPHALDATSGHATLRPHLP